MVDFCVASRKKVTNIKFYDIFGRNNPKLGSKTYGFCPPRAMGYGLLRTYGLWVALNPRPPTRWTQNGMDFRGYGLSEAWVKRVSTVDGYQVKKISKKAVLWHQPNHSVHHAKQPTSSQHIDLTITAPYRWLTCF